MFRSSLKTAARVEGEFGGEPVDVVVRTGDKSPLLRWYGLDDKATVPIGVTRRVRQLQELCTERGIAEIAVSTGWMNEEDIQSLPPEKLFDAQTALSTMKQSGNVVLDKLAIGTVAMMTPEKLLSMLHEEYDALDAMLTKLDRDDWKELHARAVAGDDTAFKQLQQEVRFTLEQELSEREGAHVSMRRGDDGEIIRNRASNRYAVDGLNLRSMTHSADAMTGRTSIVPGESRGLLHEVGARSIDELVERADNQGDMIDVLTALHVLLQDVDVSVEHIGGGSIDETVPSLFSYAPGRGEYNYAYTTKKRFAATVGVLAVLVATLGSTTVSQETGWEIMRQR